MQGPKFWKDLIRILKKLKPLRDMHWAFKLLIKICKYLKHLMEICKDYKHMKK